MLPPIFSADNISLAIAFNMMFSLMPLADIVTLSIAAVLIAVTYIAGFAVIDICCHTDYCRFAIDAYFADDAAISPLLLPPFSLLLRCFFFRCLPFRFSKATPLLLFITPFFIISLFSPLFRHFFHDAAIIIIRYFHLLMITLLIIVIIVAYWWCHWPQLIDCHYQ